MRAASRDIATDLANRIAETRDLTEVDGLHPKKMDALVGCARHARPPARL
jgi:hypothetical protein